MRRRIYDEDHEAFRESVRAFVRREVLPDVEDWAADKAIPRSFWRAAGAQGLLGLEIPVEYGGADAQDFRFNAVLMEELAAVNAALPSSVGIHADIVPPYLVKLAGAEVRDRWLPRISSGEAVAAIAMTEPGAGSDLAAITTSAVADGDRFRINGSKTYITNGYGADLVVVAARTTPAAGAKGISLFAVPTDLPGFSRGRKLDKIGQPEADTAELFFEDVVVPASHLVGELDKGFGHMMTWLPQERISAAVTNLAHARQLLTETIDYAKERKAFRQPIGSFQANKFLLAELVTRVEVTQAYVDQCVLAHAEHELTPVDAAKAKWWTAEVQNQVLDHCLQLHGGAGYMNEYRIARAWRDARVTKIWAGSNEIMKELIGRDLGF
ncbi:acyl-CoA dehydrogenase family protein [Flexivirga oryzae]|uniref:Long-chain-acyl-CoA dehydrogenase n=1 Tax=Flexivirga oryzae TaxID=1794944 RepID=A0A839N3Y3_9MICO|nr:acyl-CoA dehydrogenase family protein [Flexivirga oryzae]MBB2892470.1 long-chain-acyl-CoA dehydrogenase [Flexivirga oryzae]